MLYFKGKRNPIDIDELRVFLNDQNIDVLAINETRLNESILDQEVKVQGYDIIRRDRSTNGRFGVEKVERIVLECV